MPPKVDPSLPKLDTRVTVQGYSGVVKFVGETKFAQGIWVGVAFDEPAGKNDGSVQGHHYFRCPPSHGMFIRATQLAAETVPSKSIEAKAKPAIPKGKADPKSKAGSSGQLTKRGEASSSLDAKAKVAEPKPKVKTPGSTGPEGLPKAGPAPKHPETEPPPPKTSAAAAPASAAAVPATSAAAPPPAAAAPAPATAAPALAQTTPPKVAAAAAPPSPKAPQVSVAPKAEEARGPSEVAAPADTAGPLVESEGRKELRKLSEKAKDLEKVLAEVQAATATMNAEHQANLARFDKASRGEEELEKELTDARRQEAALREQESALETKISQMKKAAKTTVPIVRPDEDISQEEKKERTEICRLRSLILVERSNKELSELRLEEVKMELEDIREHLAMVEDPRFFDEEHLFELHKDAIRRFRMDHDIRMKRLSLREGELTLVREQAAAADKGVDLEAMKRAREKVKNQWEAREAECKLVEAVINERNELRKAQQDLAEAHGVHEEELRAEIQRQNRRVQKLNALAHFLLRDREDLRWQRLEAEADVARLDIRLQYIIAQKDALPMARPTAPKVAGGDTAGEAALVHMELASTEVEAVKCCARAQGAICSAVAWATCLPAVAKEEADLGTSFATLCSLHRVYQKATTLSSFIHHYYMQDASLAVLQSSAPMEWLCSVCLAATLISYSTVSVLGRLHSCREERFRKLVRSSALKSCGNGEKTLDAALSVLHDALMDALGPSGVPPAEMLSSLKALGAQITSVEKAFFKDEPFASWQSASCAVEACRSACSYALYASADAGGSRRDSWQRLYNKANRARDRVGTLMTPKTSFFEVEPNLVELSPEALEVAVEDNGGPPAAEAPAVDDTDDGSEKKPATAAATDAASNAMRVKRDDEDVKDLDQIMLDTLLLQVLALESGASCEPSEEKTATDLDYALTQAGVQLENIVQATKTVENRRKQADAGAVTNDDSEKKQHVELPWLEARRRLLEHITYASENGEKEIKEFSESSIDLKKKSADLQAATLDAHAKLTESAKEFSKARIESEGCDITEEQVVRMQRHSHCHLSARSELDATLQSEQSRARELQQEIEQTRKRCRELQVQLADVEARLNKKFSTGMSPEDVIALRRTNARHQRELVELNFARQKNASRGLLLREKMDPDVIDLLKSVQGMRADDNFVRRRTANDSDAFMTLAKVANPSAELTATFRRVRQIQFGFLKECASSTVVDLGGSEPGRAIEEQRLRLQTASVGCGQLKDAVTSLQHDAVEVVEDGGLHGSVAFSRFVRTGTRSMNTGPCLRLGLPGGQAKGSLAALADAEEISSLHRQILP